MSDAYVGEIRLFGGTFYPNHWRFCDGSLLDINEFDALYSIIGTFYGGDGRTNFRLPDLRSRVAIGSGRGVGLSNRIIGQFGGTEYQGLSLANLPSHTHQVENTVTAAVGATTGTGDTAAPENGVLLGAGIDVQSSTNLQNYIQNSQDLVKIKGGHISAGLDVLDTGGGQAHYNLQPWTAINYIICTTGLYPPRH